MRAARWVMTEAAPFERRRFRSAAPHYLAGRAPYAERLIRRVAAVCALGPGDRVMDLGCGPGQLARAFAPFVAAVDALDPEPEMLNVARAHSAGFANIAWRRAGSEDLQPDGRVYRMVCMGRSFHWMDRAETLRRLDAMIVPGGTVALLHDRRVDVPENAWFEAYRAIMEPYREDDATRARHRRPGWVRHEAVLLESAFAEVEEIAAIERRVVTRETLVERALSMSSSSRERLGARADEMVAALRSGLPERVHEVLASTALLARRPGSTEVGVGG